MYTPPKHYEGFKYRETIRLAGHLNNQAATTMTINDWWSIHLGQAEFLVTATLACHSLALAGKGVPIRVDTTTYLSAEQILNAIDKFLKNMTNGPGVLENATPPDITTIIDRLRNKLFQMGFNKSLIQTGPGHRGYRLEIPPENVSLYLVHPDTGVVWNLNGAG